MNNFKAQVYKTQTENIISNPVKWIGVEPYCEQTIIQPVDCVVSDWSEYSSCENGTQSRTRTVITPAQNGGASCPVLTESRSCTVQTNNPVKWIGAEPYCEQETIAES